MPFDTIFPTFLQGQFDTPVVIDPDSTPNRVLQNTLPFTVRLDWRVHGPFASALGGTWKVSLSLEDLSGDQAYKNIFQQDVLYTDVMPGSNSTNRIFHLDAQIPVQAPPILPGVYQLVALILYHDPTNNPAPMAAFSEGPTVAFYEPGP